MSAGGPTGAAGWTRGGAEQPHRRLPEQRRQRRHLDALLGVDSGEARDLDELAKHLRHRRVDHHLLAARRLVQSLNLKDRK